MTGRSRPRFKRRRPSPLETEIEAVARETALAETPPPTFAPLVPASESVRAISKSAGFFVQETYDAALEAVGHDVFAEVAMYTQIARESENPLVRMAALRELRANAEKALGSGNGLLIGTTERITVSREHKTAALLAANTRRVTALLEPPEIVQETNQEVDQRTSKEATQETSQETSYEPSAVEHESVPEHSEGGIQRGSQPESPDAAGRPPPVAPVAGPDGDDLGDDGRPPAWTGWDGGDGDDWAPAEVQAEEAQSDESVYGHRPPAPGYLRPTDLGICRKPSAQRYSRTGAPLVDPADLAVVPQDPGKGAGVKTRRR